VLAVISRLNKIKVIGCIKMSVSLSLMFDRTVCAVYIQINTFARIESESGFNLDFHSRINGFS